MECSLVFSLFKFWSGTNTCIYIYLHTHKICILYTMLFTHICIYFTHIMIYMHNMLHVPCVHVTHMSNTHKTYMHTCAHTCVYICVYIHMCIYLFLVSAEVTIFSDSLLFFSSISIQLSLSFGGRLYLCVVLSRSLFSLSLS